MTTHSLDSVLAAADASEQEIADTNDETIVDTEQGSQEDSEQDHSDEADQGRDAQGALHAERNRVKRKYTETVADFERRLTETSDGFKKQLSDTLAERDRQWEQRFNMFAQTLQPRKEPEPPAPAPDVYENPDGFLQHGIRQALDPVQQQIAKITEGFSRRMAIKEHGAEKVQAAFAALDQAAKSGNRDAIEAVARVKQSDDPFGDIVDWHERASVISEVGKDPKAFIQAQLEKALEDPAFLAKALEKVQAGKKPAAAATSANSNAQTIPSLNRITAAADEADDIEDAGEVFNTALRGGVRR